MNMKKGLVVIVMIVVVITGIFFFSRQDFHLQSQITNTEVSYRQKQAVTELKCVKSNDYAFVFKSLNGGTVIASSEEYDEKNDKNISHVYIIDIMNDKVLYHLDKEGSYTLKDIYQNQIVIANEQSSELEFYDLQLHQTDSLKVNDLMGYLYNGQYYYLDQSALFVMDIQTKKSQLVNVENNMRFGSLSGLDDHYLICYPFIDETFQNNCVAVLDIDDGSFLILNDKYVDIQGDNHFRVLKEYDEDKNGLYYMYTYPIHDKYYTTKETELSKKYLNHIPHTQYFYEVNEAIENNEKQIAQMTMYHMDQTITVCDLKDYGYNNEIYGLTYLDKENLMIGYNQSIVIVDPLYLEFKECCEAKATDVVLKDQDIIDKYNQKSKTTVKGLKKAKSKIKELKDRYDIDIFISTDCQKQSLKDRGFEFKDTSHYDNEEDMILSALNQLEEGLKLYPKDFFQQFYTRAKDGGVKVYLVADIKSSYSAIAFEYEEAYQQNIVIDIDNSEIKQTFCHELWHAMENIAISKDGTILDDWNQLNPKGFEYTGEYEGYNEREDLNRYNYLFGEEDIKSVYFIDNYSHTYDKEDRARIVEFFMTLDDETKNELKKSPHLLKKVNKLNEVIEETFSISFKM